jgi:hypothetical protein
MSGEHMRIVPTMLHGIADYVVGFIVIGLPLYFELSGTSRMVLIALGVIVVLYSLPTDYKLSPCAVPANSFSPVA